MPLTNIDDPAARPAPGFALFNLGFRPFFSAAGLFAVVAMLLWMLLYVFALRMSPGGLAPVTWHAHEMVYGYAMAVVAGFLLTAVANWTGIRTIRGLPLAVLLLLWLAARLACFLPYASALPLAAVADLLFITGLIVAVSLPVFRARQWQQMGVITKLWLMLATNGMFYAGALGYLDEGIRWGIHTGLYLILGLVFMMARRVLPFFIERGADEDFTPRNRRWIDIASLVMFLAWAILDVFTQRAVIVGWLSFGLLAVHTLRLIDWHTPSIWKKPLLWSLFLAYVFLCLGFLLKALSVWQGVPAGLALHAFAVGGIGLMTIGMMSRITLGHTGRDVYDPPGILAPVFGLMVLAAVVRVVLPLLAAGHYTLWIAVSQVMWIVAFTAFLAVYLPQLMRPRLDGRPG